MGALNVWIRPMDSFCRVRVDGMKNAERILERLSRSFVFKTSDPVNAVQSSSHFTFRVAYSSQMSPSRFERLLSAIPEVQLMPDPA